MTRLLTLFCMGLLLASPAWALPESVGLTNGWAFAGGQTTATTAPTPPPPTCSAKLDFSQACNSMYVAAIFH